MQEHQPLLDGGKAIGDLPLPPQIAGLVLGDGVGGGSQANVEEVCLHLAPIGVLCHMRGRNSPKWRRGCRPPVSVLQTMWPSSCRAFNHQPPCRFPSSSARVYRRRMGLRSSISFGAGQEKARGHLDTPHSLCYGLPDQNPNTAPVEAPPGSSLRCPNSGRALGRAIDDLVKKFRELCVKACPSGSKRRCGDVADCRRRFLRIDDPPVLYSLINASWCSVGADAVVSVPSMLLEQADVRYQLRRSPRSQSVISSGSPFVTSPANASASRKKPIVHLPPLLPKLQRVQGHDGGARDWLQDHHDHGVGRWDEIDTEPPEPQPDGHAQSRKSPPGTTRRNQLTFACFWCSMRISASCGYSVPSKRLKS